MSLLGKIAKAFFEEEPETTEVIDEHEIEDISSIHEKIAVKTDKQPPVLEDLDSAFEVKKEPLAVPIKDSGELKKSENKPFIDIKIDNLTSEKARRSRQSRETIVTNAVEKSFETIISPIYGKSGNSDDVASVSKDELFSARPKKQNPLGTIISPFYGKDELDEFEEQAQQKLHSKNALKTAKKAGNTFSSDISDISTSATNFESVEDDFNSDESSVEAKLKEYSIDEILDNDHESIEDLMQYSLFGEPTPVIDTEEGGEKAQAFKLEE